VEAKAALFDVPLGGTLNVWILIKEGSNFVQ
jgi:hypothetical protein